MAAALHRPAATMPNDTPAADILRHISDALVLLDLEGRIVFYNDAFASMVGHDGEDLRGASWAQLTDSATCARVNLHDLNAGEPAQVHFNIEMPGGDGTARAYCLTAAPFRDEGGHTIGVFQNFRSMDKLRDIIGLREVNDAIQHEKDRTERIVASIADGVFTVDRALVVRSFSPGMERLTGMAAGDAIGRPCADVLAGSKCDSDCPLRWTLERRASVERCHELFHAGGRALPVSITTAFLTQAGADETLVAVVQDRSEIERLRRELAAKWPPPVGPEPQGEEAELRRALEAHRWNASRTARALGISRTTLWRKMRRFALLPRA